MDAAAEGGSYFEELPYEEQQKIRRAGDQMVRLAQQHALAIIIAPPPSAAGKVNSASGFLLRLESKTYLFTAAHVLAGFEARVEGEPAVRWQVADLLLDPRGRDVYRDNATDVVAFELTSAELAQIPVPVISTPLGWPPPAPTPGEFILVCGYPAVIRQQPSAKRLEFRALSAMFEVTVAGEYHLVTQWDRNSLVSFSGPGIPAPGTELGGMSGGPVFLVRDLVYPLVGLITDFHTGWELLRVATLSGVDLH